MWISYLKLSTYFTTALWSFIQAHIVRQLRKHAAPGGHCFSMQFLVDRTTYTTALCIKLFLIIFASHSVCINLLNIGYSVYRRGNFADDCSRGELKDKDLVSPEWKL